MERGGNNGTPGAAPRTNPAGIRIVGMPARQAGPPAVEQWTTRNLEPDGGRAATADPGPTTSPTTSPTTGPDASRGLTLDRGPVHIPTQAGDRTADRSVGLTLDLTDTAQSRPRGPEAARPPRRGRRVLLAGLACLLTGGLAGSGLALADRSAAREQRTVVPVLDSAATTAAGIDTASRPLDPTRMVERLTALQQSQQRVQAATGGIAWNLVAATTRRDDLARTDDRLEGLTALSSAAAGLRTSMSAVRETGAGTPDSLDTLARDLNRYASAALRARQLGLYPGGAAARTPAGTTFEQLATAAGLLPTMAGDEAPRTWTVCRSAVSRCTRFVLREGAVGSVRVVPASARRVRPDIVVTGMSAAEMLVRSGGRTTWSVPAVLDLLVATDGGAQDGTPRVSSVVAVEQHALDVIAGR